MKTLFSFAHDPIKLLIIDNDSNYSFLLAEYFTNLKCKVDCIDDANKAWNRFTNRTYDACLIDSALKDIDGTSFAKKIRDYGSDVPIYIMCNSDSKELIISCYKSGADNVFIKPFSPEIAAYNLSAMLERIKGKERETLSEYQIGNLRFNTIVNELYIDNSTIALSSKESDLLLVLVKNVNTLVDRGLILRKVWQTDNCFASRSLSVYINHLRNKLSADPNIKIISSHGKGYKLVC